MKIFKIIVLALFLSSFGISGFSATVVPQKGQWVIQKDSKKKQASSQKQVTQPKISTKSATAPAKKEQKKEEAKKNEAREKKFVMVNIYGDSDVEQALNFLGRFHDDCQSAAGRNSQSQQIECLDRCQSDENASTDPRASGGSGRTTRVFSKCNGKDCLLVSYSRGEDGSLKINFGSFHPDPEAGGPRGATPVKHNEYGYETTCRGAMTCIVDSQGRGTALDQGEIYRDQNGNGCNGQKSCWAIVDEDGNVGECAGSGCVMSDEEQGGFGGSDDSTEETTDASTDTADNPDDPEDEDCSRASGGGDHGCSTLSGLELAMYEFFKQKAEKDKSAINSPSNVDPKRPELERHQYRTRIVECRGRQGPRIRPTDSQGCRSSNIGFDEGSNEDASCKDNKVSQSKRPQQRRGGGRPGGLTPDPSPLHQR